MDAKYLYFDKRTEKHVILYAGLLNAAHEAGLFSIETALVQIPGDANGQVAICQATVTLATPDGQFRRFSGIGDASPGNVNKVMAAAIIRMAETRAKARALRDAINIGEALADDPTDLDEHEPPVDASAPRHAQTPQEWFAAALRAAHQRNVDVSDLPERLAPDAPPEYATEMCKRLKARLKARLDAAK